VGKKRHIVIDYKDKTKDHANGVLKSQANVAAQGSSTSTLTSLIKTFQFFMAIVAKEKNCTDIWYLDINVTKYLTSKKLVLHMQTFEAFLFYFHWG
jgi:hypothetical protein